MKKIYFLYEYYDLGYEVIEQGGVECLAAYMQNKGWNVDIFNIIYEKNINEILINDKPDIIAISVTTQNVLSSLNAVANIKNEIENVKIIVGGIGASVEPEHILEDFPFIDAISIGEGEESLHEFCEAIINYSDYSNVKGLAYMKNGKVKFTAPRKLICNLDTLPEVMHLAYQKYKNNNNLKYIMLSTTRGCYGNCSFCEGGFRNQEGKIIRNKSAELVVAEIEHCIKKFNVRRFCFCDQTFEDAYPVGKERIEKIADLIIGKQIDIIFTIHIRTENWHEIDLPVIEKLRKAGLIGIYPGVESADSDTLKLFRKRARVDDHERAINLFNKFDVALDLGFIMYSPYTTIEILEKNMEFIKKMEIGHLAHIYFNKLINFPGVDIIKKIRSDGLLLKEPSYRDFGNVIYAYDFQDERIKYISEHIINDSNLEKLCIGKIYMLSIDWQNFISIIKLKLNNRYVLEIRNVEEEFNNMKKYYNKAFLEIFENVIQVGKNMDMSLYNEVDMNESYNQYNEKFENVKMQLFRKTILNKDNFCEKYYSY